MKELNFPPYHFKINTTPQAKHIFDVYRRKWVILTPEEWVRQHTLRYLVEEKKYPAGLLSVEKAIKVNTLLKRCDAVFYNTARKPLLIIECKSPEVEINQNVFEQAMRYNLSLQVNYLFITNGLQHYFFKTTQQGLEALKTILEWNSLQGR